MKSVLRALGRALRHTRLVPAGSPPLYRLMLIGSIISSFTQANDRQATVSVTSITPTWGDWTFIGAQLIGSVMALVGLYLIDENKEHATKLFDSLGLEFIGLLTVQVAIAVNIVAVMFYYDRIPTGQGSWFQIVFWCWSYWRLNDIWKTMRELKRP